MIQAVAMLSMLIDHLGVIFDCEAFRIVGRLAMPCYGYCLYKGFTISKRKQLYLRRLALIAFISQVPFTLLFHPASFTLNIVFSWILSALILWCKDDRKEKIFCYIAVIGISLILPIEYGVLPVLWIMLFDTLSSKEESPTKTVVYLSLIGVISSFYQYQIYSMIALVFIIISEIMGNYRLPVKYRYIWRFFYPAHMLILWSVVKIFHF